VAIDAPTGRGPTHAVGAGDLEPTLPGLGRFPSPAPYASWTRRVVAYLLDTAIIGAVTFLAVGPVGAPQILPGVTVGTSDVAAAGTSGWVVATVVAFVALQAYTGWTPGKRTVGIVVVREETGRAAGLVTTVLRWLAHLLDAILFIGFLRPLWHPRRQTFADSLLSTVVLQQRRPLVPFRGPVTGSGGPTPSRALTAVATVLSVGSAVFMLGPASYASGDVWTSTCTPTVSDASPLEVGDVQVIRWSAPGTETRWGVTRTSPVTDGAGSDTGLDASFAIDLDPAVALDRSLDAALVLHLETWQGDDLVTYRSPFRVEQRADGGSEWEVVPPTPDGSGLDAVHVPAGTLAALPPAWHWEASVVVDGETVASCGGRGST
jgi:Mce-associated membrane protein